MEKVPETKTRDDRFERTERLLGEDAVGKLRMSRVAVFGIGGVGGYVCEALARSGIGSLDLIDKDTVSISNINRQIIALESTVGRPKAEVMRERILQINPAAKVRVYNTFFLPENAGEFPFADYDYVVDAVDTVTAKLELVMKSRELKIPVISCMGAGNKLDPTAFRVADIQDTKVCPLARVMRRELKKRGVEHLKVVYSEEKPLTPASVPAGLPDPADPGRRSVPGSVAFVPSVAGLIIAGEVIRDLMTVK